MPIDHGRRRMMDGRNRRGSSFQGGAEGFFRLGEAFIAKVYDQHAVCGGDTDIIMAPIRAGTLSGVCVRKRIQQMPANAPVTR